MCTLTTPLMHTHHYGREKMLQFLSKTSQNPPLLRSNVLLMKLNNILEQTTFYENNFKRENKQVVDKYYPCVFKNNNE